MIDDINKSKFINDACNCITNYDISDIKEEDYDTIKRKNEDFYNEFRRILEKEEFKYMTLNGLHGKVFHNSINFFELKLALDILKIIKENKDMNIQDMEEIKDSIINDDILKNEILAESMLDNAIRILDDLDFNIYDELSLKQNTKEDVLVKEKRR